MTRSDSHRRKDGGRQLSFFPHLLVYSNMHLVLSFFFPLGKIFLFRIFTLYGSMQETPVRFLAWEDLLEKG